MRSLIAFLKATNRTTTAHLKTSTLRRPCPRQHPYKFLLSSFTGIVLLSRQPQLLSMEPTESDTTDSKLSITESLPERADPIGVCEEATRRLTALGKELGDLLTSELDEKQVIELGEIVQLLRQAVDHGNAEAQLLLGGLYTAGRGVK